MKLGGYVGLAIRENIGEMRAIVTELEGLYVPSRWKVWRLLQRNAAIRREQRLLARFDRCAERHDLLEELAYVEETPACR